MVAYFALGIAAVFGSVYVGVHWSLDGWVERLVVGFSWILGGLLLAVRLCGRRDVLVGSYAVGVLAGWALGIGVFVFGGPIDDYFSRLEFDSARWKRDAVEEGERPDRQRMVHDLLDRGLVVGRSRAQLEALLGAPDSWFGQAEDEVVYVLGPGRGWGFSTELFAVRVGADGKAVDAHVWHRHE